MTRWATALMASGWAQDVSPAAFRAMSALLLLSPVHAAALHGPGVERRTPFLYFTDHNEELGRLVTEGRRKEFAGFTRFAGDTVPDPQASETFERSRLDWGEAERPPHSQIRALYRELLRLRATEPTLKEKGRGSYEARALGPSSLVLERRGGGQRLLAFISVKGPLEHRLPAGARAQVVLWSEAPAFGGAVETPPLRESVVRLEGPSAVVVRLLD